MKDYLETHRNLWWFKSRLNLTPIRTGLLMPESPSMNEFMYDFTIDHTASMSIRTFFKIYNLFSIAIPTQSWWIASTTWTTVWILLWTIRISFNIIRLCCPVSKEREMKKVYVRCMTIDFVFLLTQIEDTQPFLHWIDPFEPWSWPFHHWLC